jgi:NAD+ kinase
MTHELRRIGVVVHPSRNVDEPLTALKEWAGANDVELGQIGFRSEERRVADECEGTDQDLIVAIGGDGTTLAGIHAVARTDRPVLGIACGSLGVLTAVPADSVATALDRYVAGDWTARSLPALELRLDTEDELLAFNDIVIARRGGGQVRVAALIDGELFARFAGDGCVVSTPLGSSAYTIAAGGPLLPLGLEAFCLTPLAQHGGFRPPLVVDAASTLELKTSAGYGGARLEVDGQLRKLESDRLTVRYRSAAAQVVTFPDLGGFVTRLRQRGVITDSPRILAEDERLGRGERKQA